MDDITETPYAEFLEQMIGSIMKYQPEAISVQCILPDGNIASWYFNCSMNDKLTMAGTMQHDATMDAIVSNKDWLRRLLEDEQE